MKLTKQQASPYLPYGVMIQNSIGKIIELTVMDFSYHFEKGFKPILRPLSDLKENLELKENLYKSHKINMYWHKWEALENKNNYKELEYLPKCIFDMLVENHFDVFGLIDAGLAIDINTL
jgi:hypothetical protein